MTDFLMCWIVVLLATISLQLQSASTPKLGDGKREAKREMVSVLVTTFLVALIFYAIFSLVWINLLNR